MRVSWEGGKGREEKKEKRGFDVDKAVHSCDDRGRMGSVLMKLVYMYILCCTIAHAYICKYYIFRGINFRGHCTNREIFKPPKF